MSRQAPDARSVHFDIGHITLHGYSRRDGARFERALRTHLTDLAVAQQGTWPASHSHSIERLDAGTIPAGTSPEHAARLIAARVLSAVASGPVGRAGAPHV
jgi:hypothetical protein